MSKHRAQHRAPRRLALPALPYVPVRRLLVTGACSLVAGTALATGLVATATAGSGGGTGGTAADTLAAPVDVPAPAAEPTETTAAVEPPAVLEPEEATTPAVPTVREVADQDLSEVPEQAVAAYERAATVMSDSRVGCQVRWTTLAAVARVESDHGRRGGGELDDDGVVRPALHGDPLDGKGGRDRVRDTDRGKVDDLRTWDRPVGPLGFLPTEWAVYGVDADDDGRRDVQDIDDAALASAVQLCATSRDLVHAKPLGRALAAFDPARGYAAQVMEVARSYAEDLAAQEDAAANLPVVVANDPVVDPEDEEEPTRPARDEHEPPAHGGHPGPSTSLGADRGIR